MKTDFSSDDNLTAPPASGDLDLERVYTRPGYTFKGRPLHPYSHGIDLLFSQVTDFANDTQFYHWVAFLFLLVVRDPALTAIDDRKRHVLPLAWNMLAFRAALVEWLDDIKWVPADTTEAERLFNEIRAEADGTAVEIVGGSSGKKKSAERSRPKPRSSSARSAASTAATKSSGRSRRRS
jgi:hypothetical protein